MEKYSCYEFEIEKIIEFCDKPALGFVYKIYTEGCKPHWDGVIESNEWFDTEQQARFAAVGHIDLLENGEG